MKGWIFAFSLVFSLAPGTTHAQGTEALHAAEFPLTQADAQLGGIATVHDQGVNAFGFAARGIGRHGRRAFAVGNALFKENWITAPASAAGRDGLGPFFNARSCSACHLRDGRGSPPRSEDPKALGLLLRLGVPGPKGDLPHPIYGDQLQDRALQGIEPEAGFDIEETRIPGRFADGRPYELIAPRYRLRAGSFGGFGPQTRVGPRIAPQIIGLGLLEAISEDRLRSLADPQDKDGDGISGRVHELAPKTGEIRRLGRFGWKATQATVREQTAAAFLGDIGVTSPLFPEESLTPVQRRKVQAPSGGSPEIDDHKLDRVSFYSAALAVPAARGFDRPEVRRGRFLFDRIGCAACHIPDLDTGEKAAIRAFGRQRIHPYTDLLLHDMGPGLADEKTDGEAQPREWRTPPLWGLGLVETVNGHRRFLHDGRARGLEEAVLWHGGEAQSARDRYRELSATARDNVIAFLRAL
jgi:CxxC motif-containing protein (DUF1111 family)